jgi:hypothetical protein
MLQNFGSANLWVTEVKVQPAGGTFGDSGVAGDVATVSIVVKNIGSPSIACSLDFWPTFAAGSTPSFGSTSSLNLTIPALANNASVTASLSFTYLGTATLYTGWALVDSQLVNNEAPLAQLNNRKFVSYPVIEVAQNNTVINIPIGIPAVVSLTFSTFPANVKWAPLTPSFVSVLNFGSISSSGTTIQGKATYNYSTAAPHAGSELFIVVAGATSSFATVNIVDLSSLSHNGVVLGIGQSFAFGFSGTPTFARWPVNGLQFALTTSAPGVASILGTSTSPFNTTGTVTIKGGTVSGVATLSISLGTATLHTSITVSGGEVRTAAYQNTVALSYLQNNGTTIAVVPSLHWATGSLANDQNSYTITQAAPIAYVRNNNLVVDVSIRIPPNLSNVLSLTAEGTTSWAYGDSPITSSQFGAFGSVSSTLSGGIATLRFTSTGSYSVVDVHSLTTHWRITRFFTADGSFNVSVDAGSFTNRLYTLLDAPTGAWAIPTNPRTLVELLEIACEMTSGAGSPDTVAALLTNEIHRSGWTFFRDGVLFFNPTGTLIYNPNTARTAFPIPPALPTTQNFPITQLLRDLGTIGFLQCNDINNFLALNAQAVGVNLTSLYIRNFNYPTITPSPAVALHTADALTAGTDVVRRYDFDFHQVASLSGFVYDAAVSRPQLHAPYSGETLAGYLTAVFPGFSVSSFNVATTTVNWQSTHMPLPFTVARILSGTLSVRGIPGSTGSVTLEVFNITPLSDSELGFVAVFGGTLTATPTITVVGTATTGTNRGTVTLQFGVGTTITPTPASLRFITPNSNDGVIFEIRP